MARMPFIVILAVLAFAAAAPAASSAADDLPATQEEAVARFREALRAGDEGRAVDLLCAIDPEAVDCGDPAPGDDFQRDWQDLWRRRYDAAFTPPANADSMSACGWERVAPGWGFARHGVAVRGWREGEPRVRHYYPFIAAPSELMALVDAGPERSYLILQKDACPRLLIDVDLDGEAEITFNGEHLTVAEGRHDLRIDESPDGTRQQWLVAAVDRDPKRSPFLWIYRDGCHYTLFLDVDGDGRGDCGLSDRL